MRDQRAEPPADLGALDRFGRQQRDLLGVIGHARGGEAEVGLAALLLEIQVDQPPADQMRDQRADAGIESAIDDQIAGEREIDAEQRQRRGRGQSATG